MISFYILLVHLFNFILELFPELLLCTGNYTQYTAIKKFINPTPKTQTKVQSQNRNKPKIIIMIIPE